MLTDPRFATNAARVASMQQTDEMVTGWTMTKTRQELMAAAKAFRFLCAPVRDLAEVMSDRHLFERGVLQWIEHPELGRVVLPNSPLRFHGVDPVRAEPSRALGADNDSVYGAWLGLPAERLLELRSARVI
ncbi:hypothetical protein C2U70_07680 [Bradyrhizobium guangdongense]|nr:hypothetical protein C2U70_07680 [Bradyrhizobium guangdongense]